MMGSTPTTKFGRALAGGKTAAKTGGALLGYYAKRPFLSPQSRQIEKTKSQQAGARALFSGLTLLKGTALKVAQQLSLETDMLPEAVCKELSRAYHQVPPINKALVRKVVQNELGAPPEDAFKSFDLEAFAAASLGQVHRATAGDGRRLAVKIQYPGIADTIENDMALVRQMLRPMVPAHQLMPALTEVTARLKEEVNYLQEAENITCFDHRLNMEGVRLPEVHRDLTTGSVLSLTLLPGRPLDIWLTDGPTQKERQIVARRLNAIFLKSLYECHVIHADPNPGNFIIDDNLNVGLVDFGCVKHLSPEFIEQYRQLVASAAHDDKFIHYQVMMDIGMLQDKQGSEAEHEVRAVSDEICNWFGTLYQTETFNFKTRPDFMARGKALMHRCQHLHSHINVNPDFIFLERTRYGLFRLFEQMAVSVSFRNSYEW
jgi:predicted unusual protein kinase regulating ubiquinone biosynthesis (AarF/ABC1/UbiB family)